MGREPAAAGHGLVDDRNRPAVGQIYDVIERFALGDALGKACSVFVGVA